MSCDAANRLTTTVNGSILGKYMFDHHGSMTVESVGRVATSYTYDSRNKLSIYTNGLGLGCRLNIDRGSREITRW